MRFLTRKVRQRCVSTNVLGMEACVFMWLICQETEIARGQQPEQMSSDSWMFTDICYNMDRFLKHPYGRKSSSLKKMKMELTPDITRAIG